MTKGLVQRLRCHENAETDLPRRYHTIAINTESIIAPGATSLRYFFADCFKGVAIAFTGSPPVEAAFLALSAFGFFASLLLRI